MVEDAGLGDDTGRTQVVQHLLEAEHGHGGAPLVDGREDAS